MRFVASVWALMLTALLIFTLMVFSHQFFAADLPAFTVRFSVLAGNWVIGLASATVITILYKRVEKVIQQAARDETVVQLAGAVAHELNQPLTVIVSGAELMAHKDRSPEEIKNIAGTMSEASQRMEEIVLKLQKAMHYRAKPYVGNIKIVDLDATG